jgi:hypothetical protein
VRRFRGRLDGFALPGIEIDNTRLVRGGNSYRFTQPIHPDDVITATWRFDDM